MKKFFTISVMMLAVVFTIQAQPKTAYTLVTYNVENLFDADGYSIFDDYKPFDEEGNPKYTNSHILTKIKNIATIMKKYNDGKGPDVILFVELESDYTPSDNNWTLSAGALLKRYEETTIDKMLGDEFNDEVKDLPSHLLLLKGMHDYGLKGYDFQVGYGPLDNDGKPSHVQKNVTFSKLPFMQEKTQVHLIERARPVLETWIDVQGYPLIVFNNHWKSGASNEREEATRYQNGLVVRARIDQIFKENPKADIILGGDFNAQYNQHERMPTQKTGIHHGMKVSGDEKGVATSSTGALYNLWYELPHDERGTEVYRGEWGTLMQLIISTGMYDNYGVQYVDNSLEVGKFLGLNAYETTGGPIRWDSFGTGHGFSDHLPLSMQFTVSKTDNTIKLIEMEKPGVENIESKPVKVTYTLPDRFGLKKLSDYKVDIRTNEHYDQYFYISAEVDKEAHVEHQGVKYLLYSPAFNVKKELGEYLGTGKKLTFIGRLVLYKTTWEFIIEDKEFILNPN